MKLKQKLVAILAVLLLLLQVFPAFALSEESLQEPTTTTAEQDSGTPPEPSDNLNKPSDPLPEPDVPSTETPTVPSDEQESEDPAQAPADPMDEPEAGDTVSVPVLLGTVCLRSPPIWSQRENSRDYTSPLKMHRRTCRWSECNTPMVVWIT